MSLVQDEIITQNNNLFISGVNKQKLKGTMRMIEAVLYFIQNQLEEANQTSGMRSRPSELLINKCTIKPKKIKETHLILLMTLAKKCLDEGLLELVDTALSVQITIVLVNEELLSQPEYRAKVLSQDFVWRYLNHLIDFVKVDMQSLYSDNKCEFGCQIYELWKLLVQNMEKRTDLYALFFAFIIHFIVSPSI